MWFMYSTSNRFAKSKEAMDILWCEIGIEANNYGRTHIPSDISTI